MIKSIDELIDISINTNETKTLDCHFMYKHQLVYESYISNREITLVTKTKYYHFDVNTQGFDNVAVLHTIENSLG